MVAGDGDSLVPAYGGVVSVGAGLLRRKGKNITGPPTALTKGCYAAALRDQIQVNSESRHDAQQKAPSTNADLMYPFGDMFGAGAGPPPDQKGYAAALKEQMRADSQKRADMRAAEDSLDRAVLNAQAFSRPSPRRLLMPAPSRPAKASYAADLEEQMEAQKLQRRANAEAAKTPLVQPGYDAMPGEDPVSAGKRRVAPTSMPKQDYASELRGQMAERQERAQRDQFKRTSDEQRSPFAFVSKEQQQPRGMRPSHQIELDSKERYNQALLEQMAAKAADKAANAYHKQASNERASSVGPVQPDSPRGGRARGGVAPMSKEAYAAALEEQIVDRNFARARAGREQAATRADSGSCVIPRGGRELTPRMRQIESVEPAAYQEVLRGQIAARDAQKAAQAFHVQRPDVVSPRSSLPQGEERAQGKRCIGYTPASVSAEQYANDLKQQIVQREGARIEQNRQDDVRLARQLHEAHHQLAERQGAILQQQMREAGVRPERPPEARDALDHLMSGAVPGGQW